MSFLVIVGGMMVVLGVLAFITRRRFGVLGLALATGALMSTVWVGDVTPLVAQTGLQTLQPPLESIVGAVLTLLPAVVLLLSGPISHAPWQRIGGAILFALLAITLLLEPLSAALVIDGPGRLVYEALGEYRIFIVTGCIVVALLDAVAIKSPKRTPKH